MSHTHTMKDTDPVFYIDADSRTIKSTYEGSVTLVKGDHNSEIFTFEMDRYIDEHDLKQCNKVEVHYINIDANNSKNKNYGIYTVTDLTVDPSDSEGILFTWKVPITATTYAGALSFVVRFECTEGEEILYAWNTTPCNEVSVLDSIYNTEFIEEEYTDVIGEWYNEILSAKNQALDEIGKSGGIVVSRTEPESDDVNVWVDNSEEEVVMLLEASDCVKMANSIKGNTSGEVIRLDDVSPLEHGIKAKVRGKNLFDISQIEEMTASDQYAYISDVGANYLVITTTTGYTGNVYCTFTKKTLKDICPNMEVGRTYTLSASTESNSTNIYFPGIQKSWVFGKSIVATEELLNSALTFYGLSAKEGYGTGDCTIVNIQIEEGEVATDYEPYIDPTTVTVTGCGKNLFGLKSCELLKSWDGQNPNITITNDNEFIITNNVADDWVGVKSKDLGIAQLLTIRVVAQRIDTNQDDKAQILVTDGKEQENKVDAAKNEIVELVWTSPEPTKYMGVKISPLSQFKITKIQVEVGTKQTEYEVYKEEKAYKPDVYGNCEIDSFAPTTTIFTDKSGVNIQLEYNKDINKVLANLPSGGNENNKQTKTGECLVIDNISSVERDVKVKLTSDTVTDFSTVKTIVCGKNLFKLDNVDWDNTSATYLNPVINDDGSITITNSNPYAGKQFIWLIDIPRNVKLTLTVPETGGVFNLRSCLDDGTNIALLAQLNKNSIGNVFTFTATNYSKVKVEITVPMGVVTYKGIQLEVSEVTTEFEKANVKSYTPNSNGGVNDVKSVYPTMTIFTNTSGVNIEAEYNADDGILKTIDEKVEIAKQEILETVKPKSKVTGYKMAVIGDSISVGVSSVILSDGSAVPATTGDNLLTNVNKSWWQQVKDRYGIAEVINNSASGASYSIDGSTKDDSGNIVNRRFTTYLNETDLPADLDIIMVFGGTNDWSQSRPLGTTEDAPSVENAVSVCSAIRAVLDYLTIHFPESQIVVVTPLQRYKSDTFNPANTSGKYLRDFVNAIKIICADYGVQVVDLYANSKFHMNSETFRTTYVPDGTHPNAAGTDRYVTNGIFPTLDKLWLSNEI